VTKPNSETNMQQLCSFLTCEWPWSSRRWPEPQTPSLFIGVIWKCN